MFLSTIIFAIMQFSAAEPFPPGTACDSNEQCGTGFCVTAVCCKKSSCDDHNECTADWCDYSGNCQNDPFDLMCDTPGECEDGPGTCHPDGSCTYTHLPDGTVCKTGICEEGLCVKEELVDGDSDKTDAGKDTDDAAMQSDEAVFDSEVADDEHDENDAVPVPDVGPGTLRGGTGCACSQVY